MGGSPGRVDGGGFGVERYPEKGDVKIEALKLRRDGTRGGRME